MTETPTSGRTVGGGTPHVTEDQCLDLLHNLLTEGERETALAHMAICPDCEKLFQARFAEHERLRAAGELRRETGGELVFESTEPPAEEERPGLWDSLRRLIGSFRRPQVQLAGGLVTVAAVVLLLIVPRQPAGPDLAELHWLPGHSEDLSFRAVPEAAGPDFTEGLEAYAQRDLDGAIESLEKTEVTGTLDTVRRIYLSSALAWDGQYEKAVEILRAVSTPAVPDPWGSEARWSLYVALKGSGRTTSADSLLRVLSEEPGEVGERARGILGQ